MIKEIIGMILFFIGFAIVFSNQTIGIILLAISGVLLYLAEHEWDK